MPLVTVTSLKGRSKEEKKQIGDAIQTALIEIGVPEGDRFQKFLDMEDGDFIFDLEYPDKSGARSDRFMLIEVLLSVGRSVKVKKQFLAKLIPDLELLGIAPNDVAVIFIETTWENWAFKGGKLSYI